MSGDAVWVERLIAGDPVAFDRLYDAYRPRVFGFLARMTRDRPLAEDLVQETFLRLARHATRLAPDTRMLPWLLTVARNLALDHRRWMMLDLSRLTVLRRAPGPEVDTPFELRAASELEQRLEAAIAALPPKYREAVLLSADGLAPAEIATALGLSPENARQRLARGRAMLEAALHEEKP